ncbi:hypothetical protein PM082_019684 [Marasmius tenuissimus]|nr:hypothetical protein PM082_019684 [Marasmius tenuissimus]
MASSFFAGASNTKIGPGSSFQNVEGDVHHHYDATYQEEEENRVMPRQKRYREVFEGDVLVGKQTWSQETEVVIREREPLTDSVSFRDSGETRIAVVKRFHTATLYPHNYMVTVMTFEPKEKRDRETTRLLWEELYKALSAHRTRQVVQMLGLMTAEMPTFILHEELVNGDEFAYRYIHTQRLVFDYLFYTSEVAISTLRADKSLRIPVSSWWADWTFNLKTRTWHYDASTSIDQLDEDYFSSYAPTPLPEGPLPQLDAELITTYFENAFGDFVYLIASLRRRTRLDLSDYAQYGRLTFGAVVNHWEREILAHFPSSPRPEWCFENRSHNIDVGYSEKVPSRVDFQFHDTHNTRLNLYFSLRLPLEDQSRLRAAYLCQSDKDSNLSTYLIDEVGFSIAGNFLRGIKPCPAPAYLFVPLLHVKYIDGMYYIPHPLPDPLFYWSWDPKGKTVISEKDWEQHGIPELEVETCAGTFWDPDEYELVENHLRKKHYEVDGKQYAQDHGYPELIWGDPHARTIIELEDTDSDEDLENSNQHGDSEELDESCSSISQPAYPSTSLFVDLPVEHALACTGEQDTRHETTVQNSVEETRRIRGQHSTVQETRCQSNTSKDANATQRLTPSGRSLTSVSNLAYKQPKSSEQETTRETVDSRGDISTRPTRSQTPREAIAGFNAQTQRSCRESEWKTMGSLGEKTPGVGARQHVQDHGYSELRFSVPHNGEMEELDDPDGAYWSTESGIENEPDNAGPSPSTFSVVDATRDCEGTTRLHLEEKESSTATYLAQFLEFETDNTANAASQRDRYKTMASVSPTGTDRWDFLVDEDL